MSGMLYDLPPHKGHLVNETGLLKEREKPFFLKHLHGDNNWCCPYITQILLPVAPPARVLRHCCSGSRARRDRLTGCRVSVRGHGLCTHMHVEESGSGH